MGVENKLSAADAAKLYEQAAAARLRGSDVPFHPADTRSSIYDNYVAGLLSVARDGGLEPKFPTREEAEAQSQG
jgi:hypothetical protein